MGTHPNVMLMLHLKHETISPVDLLKLALGKHDAVAYDTGETDDVIIAGENYHTIVFPRTDEDAAFSTRRFEYSGTNKLYYAGFQVEAEVGCLVLLNLITYGYGESKPWDAVAKLKAALDEWAQEFCARHGCTYEIRIGANYW